MGLARAFQPGAQGTHSHSAWTFLARGLQEVSESQEKAVLGSIPFSAKKVGWGKKVGWQWQDGQDGPPGRFRRVWVLWCLTFQVETGSGKGTSTMTKSDTTVDWVRLRPNPQEME